MVEVVGVVIITVRRHEVDVVLEARRIRGVMLVAGMIKMRTRKEKKRSRITKSKFLMTKGSQRLPVAQEQGRVASQAERADGKIEECRTWSDRRADGGHQSQDDDVDATRALIRKIQQRSGSQGDRRQKTFLVLGGLT